MLVHGLSRIMVKIPYEQALEVALELKGHNNCQYIRISPSQGWFPAAFLMDENEIKGPENFKVISDYKAASTQELAAKKGQVM